MQVQVCAHDFSGCHQWLGLLANSDSLDRTNNPWTVVPPHAAGRSWLAKLRLLEADRVISLQLTKADAATDSIAQSYTPDEAYLASLKRWRQRSDAPLLPATLLSQPDLAMRHYEALGMDVSNPVIMLSEGGWGEVAVLLAMLTRRPLLRMANVAAVRQFFRAYDLKSCAIVADPRVLTSAAIAEISQACAPEGLLHEGYRCSLGFITARSAEAALELVIRGHLYEQLPPAGRTCMPALAATDLRPSEGNGVDPAILGWSEATLDNLTAQMQGHGLLDQFNLLTHGREDLMWLNDALICGRYPNAGTESDGQGLPVCAYTGSCFQSRRKLLDPAAIVTKVTFINSCCTLKLAEGVFSRDYNVGMRFLDGWSGALVATPTELDGGLDQNLLFYNLVKHGFTLGEATRLLNNSFAHAGRDVPAYLLIGDPCLKIAPGSFSEALQAECLPAQLTLPKDATLGELLLPLAPIPESKGVAVRAVHKAESQLFYAVARDPVRGRERLFLFRSRGGSRSVTVAVQAGDPIAELRDTLQRFTKAHTEWAEMDIHLQKVDRLATEVGNIKLRASRLGSAYRHSPEATEKVDRLLLKCRQIFVQAQDLVLKWLLQNSNERNFQFYEEYKGGFRVGLESVGRGSCGCGEATYEFQLEHRLGHDHCRHVIMCPSCGVVYEGPRSATVQIRFHNSVMVPAGSRTQQVVQIENRDDQPAVIGLGVCVQQGNKLGIRVALTTETISVPARASLALPFTLEIPPDAIAHMYWLRAYMLAEGHVHAAGANLFITPAESPPAHTPTREGLP